jgi:Uma2 family endonuclease
MGKPAKEKSAYQDLYGLPENKIGEIIGGELYATPRPSPSHSNVESGLQTIIRGAYQYGWRGGPGGWIILFEPELRMGEDIVVPDLAGWRKERLPRPPETNWIEIRPDWICEVLSPGTAKLDKNRKMPLYAEYSVPFLWLIDPSAKTLDVFTLSSQQWILVSSYAEDDKLRAVPFEAIEIDLTDLWWE